MDQGGERALMEAVNNVISEVKQRIQLKMEESVKQLLHKAWLKNVREIEQREAALEEAEKMNDSTDAEFEELTEKKVTLMLEVKNLRDKGRIPIEELEAKKKNLAERKVVLASKYRMLEQRSIKLQECRRAVDERVKIVSEKDEKNKASVLELRSRYATANSKQNQLEDWEDQLIQRERKQKEEIQGGNSNVGLPQCVYQTFEDELDLLGWMSVDDFFRKMDDEDDAADQKTDIGQKQLEGFLRDLRNTDCVLKNPMIKVTHPPTSVFVGNRDSDGNVDLIIEESDPDGLKQTIRNVFARLASMGYLFQE